MKKIYLPLLSLTVLSPFSTSFAQHNPPAAASFTPDQIEEVKKIVGDYLTQHPEVVITALQAEMDKKQKDDLEKMHKAIAHHKEKLFKNPHLPVAGNPKGSHSLVVFMDPYCGFCQKLHGEFSTVLEANKDLKISFIDIPIMGDQSVLAVKALLAANKQEKYAPFQKLIFKSHGKLTPKKLLKKAKSIGMDVKRFETDLEGQEIQAQLDSNLALAQAVGVNATPLIIINETTVSPGYVPANELTKMILAPIEKK